MNEALPRVLRGLHQGRAIAGSMSLESLQPETPLLSSLRARQLTSRTAQMARTLDASATQQHAATGAFNASAAAALNEWKAP